MVRVSLLIVLSFVRVLGIAARRARTEWLLIADPPFASEDGAVTLRAPPGRRLPNLDVPAEDPARRPPFRENCSCRRRSRFSSRVRARPASASLSLSDARLVAADDDG